MISYKFKGTALPIYYMALTTMPVMRLPGNKLDVIMQQMSYVIILAFALCPASLGLMLLFDIQPLYSCSN